MDRPGVRDADGELVQVGARVEAWRTWPQPNYNLNRRNCVIFVAELAKAAGIDGSPEPGLMKKPKSFLNLLRDRNAPVIATRAGATAAAADAAPAGR